MEEQFYLIWPAVLLVAGKRKALWVAVLGACACATYRFFAWQRYNHVGLDTVTQVRADALFLGCILAICLSYTAGHRIIQRAARIATVPAFGVLMYCVVHFRWLPPFAESAAITVLLAASMRPYSILSQTLSLAPLAWLGRISYSVYVWQQLFMNYRSPWFLLLAVPLFSICSYYFIERPCINSMRLHIRGDPYLNAMTAPPHMPAVAAPHPIVAVIPLCADGVATDSQAAPFDCVPADGPEA